MIRIVAAFLLLSQFAGIAHASDTSKTVKVRQIMELTHAQEIVESMRQKTKAQAEGIVAQIKTQLKANFPCMSQELWDQITLAYEQMYKDALPTYSAAEAIDVYVNLYGANLNEEDVDQVLAFYRSPAGQKVIESVRVANPQWQEWFVRQSQAAADKALPRFMQTVKKISDDAAKENCK